MNFAFFLYRLRLVLGGEKVLGCFVHQRSTSNDVAWWWANAAAAPNWGVDTIRKLYKKMSPTHRPQRPINMVMENGRKHLHL